MLVLLRFVNLHQDEYKQSFLSLDLPNLLEPAQCQHNYRRVPKSHYIAPGKTEGNFKRG